MSGSGCRPVTFLPALSCGLQLLMPHFLGVTPSCCAARNLYGGIADAEIEVPSAEHPELSKTFLCKAWSRSEYNSVYRAFSFHSTSFAFSVHSTSFAFSVHSTSFSVHSTSFAFSVHSTSFAFSVHSTRFSHLTHTFRVVRLELGAILLLVISWPVLRPDVTFTADWVTYVHVRLCL